MSQSPGLACLSLCKYSNVITLIARVCLIYRRRTHTHIHTVAESMDSPEDLITMGSWGSVISWPHIPVSAANLPDGRVLTFASNEPTSFPNGPEYTYAAVWDPVTELTQSVHHDQHDVLGGGQDAVRGRR